MSWLPRAFARMTVHADGEAAEPSQAPPAPPQPPLAPAPAASAAAATAAGFAKPSSAAAAAAGLGMARPMPTSHAALKVPAVAPSSAALAAIGQPRPSSASAHPSIRFPGAYVYAGGWVDQIVDLPVYSDELNMEVGWELTPRLAAAMRANMMRGSCWFRSSAMTDSAEFFFRLTGLSDWRAFYRQRVASWLSTDLMLRQVPDSRRRMRNGQVGVVPGYYDAALNVNVTTADSCLQLKGIYEPRVLGFNYMQSLTQRWAFGGEFMVCAKNPARWLTGYSVGAVYDSPSRTAMARYVYTNTVLLDYLQKVSPTVGFATQIIFNANTKASLTRVGYVYALQRAQARVCATVDSSGTLAATLEERLTEMLRGVLTAKFNFSDSSYVFGALIQYGPNADERKFGCSKEMRERMETAVHASLMPTDASREHGDGRPVGAGNALEPHVRFYPDSRVMQSWGLTNH